MMWIQVVGYGIILITILLGWIMHKLLKVPPLPVLSREEYWGPGIPPSKTDASIKPFLIKFEPDMIQDLKNRLEQTRYTAPYENIGFEYGFNHNMLREVVKHWSENYDFGERETFLNKFPHFQTVIQGIVIHFIHIKPSIRKNVKILPLMLLHGWPGSVREFYEVISILATPREENDFVFEIVIPSLPGFGFSQAASKTGLGAMQMAVVMINLMERLGHEEFYIQGGDWGAVVAGYMALLYPKSVLGYHTNMVFVSSIKANLMLLIGSLCPSKFVREEMVSKLYPLTKYFSEMILESGAVHIQATKPDSVGAAIGDSPAGLAAYILEKFSSGTDPSWRGLKDGGLTNKYSLTDLIDNLMFYWVSNSATTAARIYAESFNKKSLEPNSIPTLVPTAVVRFPNEMFYVTDAQLHDKFPNLLQVSDMPRGGHFAAFEEPQLLAEDIISAVNKFEQFHNLARN